MKKILCIGIAALVAGAASAEILLSWDGNSPLIPTNTTLNVSGQLWGPLTDRGSNDGWYGPDNSEDGGFVGANTDFPYFGWNIADGGSVVDVKIENNSGQDLELASLVFDYQAIWLAYSPREVEVLLVAGHLDDYVNSSNAVLLTTIDNVGESGSKGPRDYPDYVVSLKASLTDYTLADGEFAQFQFKGVDALGTANGVVDNIAFLDTVPILPPEPVTVFDADFEGSVASDATAGSLTTNNLNAGTTGGTWTLDVDGGGVGNYAAVITNLLDVAGEKVAKAFMLATGAYDATARLAEPVELAGTTVSLDAYLRNKATDAPKNLIIGLDSSGREVFEIILSGHDASGTPEYRAVGFRDASNTIIYLDDNLLQVQQNNLYEPGKTRKLKLTLSNSSLDIEFDGSILTNGIAFKDAAAEDLAEIRFVGTGGWAGMVYDNIEVAALAPTGYSPWIEGFGLSGSPDADEDYDYDLDGWDNLMEYALDGDPTNPAVVGTVPTWELTGATLDYVYSMRTDDPALSYYLVLSDDLASWADAGYTVTGTNVTGGLMNQVTNAVPTTDPHTFIRLGVDN